MSCTVAIHQPNFAPWLGYFYKMAHCDIFVFLDDVPFSKGSFTNRCSIWTPRGPQWLTVPIRTKGRSGQKIQSVEIVNTPWRPKMVRTLQQNYGKAEYFERWFPVIECVLRRPYEKLCDLNIELIQVLARVFGIGSEFILASDLKVQATKENRIIEILRAVGGSEYLSGNGARSYQIAENFEDSGFRLTYSSFQQFEYPQLGNEFIPGLSILDLFFNCGTDSIRYLKRGTNEAHSSDGGD